MAKKVLKVTFSGFDPKKHSIRYNADEAPKGKTNALDSIYVSRDALKEIGVVGVPTPITVTIEVNG